MFALQTKTGDEASKLLSHRLRVSLGLHISLYTFPLISAVACNTFARVRSAIGQQILTPVSVSLSLLPTWAPCAEKQVPLSVS